MFGVFGVFGMFGMFGMFANFLIAVLFARFKETTIVNLLKKVLSARCKNAAIVNFLIAVLVDSKNLRKILRFTVFGARLAPKLAKNIAFHGVRRAACVENIAFHGVWHAPGLQNSRKTLRFAAFGVQRA
jgi:hypothetical protein